MNQILVSEKLYVTRDMKRKKKFYKLEFFLSIFLLCLLSSYYIYGIYDRDKNEKVSKEILANMNLEEQEENLEKVTVVLNSAFSEAQELAIEAEPVEVPTVQVTQTSDGTDYYTIGRIQIPSIGVDYPIFSQTSETAIVELLKKAPCKFWGADPNQVGNFCIAGHNYRDTRFFSKVPTLENGDIIEITDLSKRTLQYSVYDKHEVDEDDTSDTNQETDGKRIVTIITCTNNGKRRVIVKAKEI